MAGISWVHSQTTCPGLETSALGDPITLLTREPSAKRKQLGNRGIQQDNHWLSGKERNLQTSNTAGTWNQKTPGITGS